ncbi:DUF1801 domain-containing protein [Candidatus Bathyarchaeota archaeon]|nr:DUF1801 domain-containing protein [Candidatus Bathyarchaeota archaeon]
MRKVLQKTLPNSAEEMRWGVITYAARKFCVVAMKNRVQVGFAITGLSKDEMRLFEGTGKAMRRIKIPTIEDVDEEKLVKLIEIVNKKAICKST